MYLVPVQCVWIGKEGAMMDLKDKTSSYQQTISNDTMKNQNNLVLRLIIGLIFSVNATCAFSSCVQTRTSTRNLKKSSPFSFSYSYDNQHSHQHARSCMASNSKLSSSSTPQIERDADTSQQSIATQEQLDEYAKSVGVEISLTTLGPGYRAVARAVYDPEQILGYCEGFVRPAGDILHVDKLEVWKKALDRAKKENPEGFKNGGQVFGVSILLGYRTMLFGKEKGCDRAEFLAIDDEAFQHKRLVRFFRRAGFQKIRYVGEDISNIPDRLVWGGCGTLMNQKVNKLLSLWTKIVFK